MFTDSILLDYVHVIMDLYSQNGKTNGNTTKVSRYWNPRDTAKILRLIRAFKLNHPSPHTRKKIEQVKKIKKTQKYE